MNCSCGQDVMDHTDTTCEAVVVFTGKRSGKRLQFRRVWAKRMAAGRALDWSLRWSVVATIDVTVDHLVCSASYSCTLPMIIPSV